MRRKAVAILLAAGNSKRMGTNKLALPLGSATIGHKALYTAVSSLADHTIVAVKKGDNAGWIRHNDLPSKKWSVLECGHSCSGQSFSIRKSVQRAEALGADAIIVLLADQPFVDVGIINKLIEMYRRQPVSFIASCFNNVPQPPVLFSAVLFSALKKLNGDQGAGFLLKDRVFSDKGLFLHYNEARLFFDVDTPSDYKQAVKGEIE